MKNKKVPQLRFSEFQGEWVKTNIKDLGNVITGSTPSTSNQEYYGDNHLFVSPGDINQFRYINDSETKVTELGFNEGRQINAGSTLFVSIGSTIGKVGQTTKKCITNQQINSIVPNDNYNKNFIYSLLERYSSKIKTLTATQAVPIINKSNFESFVVTVPPKKEQQKIADFFSSIDQKIQQLRKKKELLEEYKKGVMQKLFSQEVRFNDESGEDFPEWEIKKMGELFDRVTRKNEEDNQNVLTISAQDGLINQEEYFNRSVAAKDLTGYYLLRKGEFAYNKSYSNGYPLGAIKRLTEYEKGVVSTLYICFKLKEGNSETFYEEFLDHGGLNHEIYKIAQEGSRNHGLLNVSVIDFFKDIKVTRPSFREQKRIANFLDSISEKIEVASHKLHLAEDFKKGLLQQMFV